MYKKRKAIYSLGIVGALAIPAITIISCGSNDDSERQETDQKKLNEITSTQIADVLDLHGSPDKYASNIGHANSQLSLVPINGLSGVVVHVNEDWKASDIDGQITFTVNVKKSGLKDHVIKITIENYNKDQGKLNAITPQDIIDEYLWTADENVLPGAAAATMDIAERSNIELHGLTGVNISNIVLSSNNQTGKMTLVVQVGHVNLESKTLVVEMQFKAQSDLDKNFNAITVDQVLEAMDNYAADENKWADDTGAPPEQSYAQKTINTLPDIDITIDLKSTNIDKYLGQNIFDATITNATYGSPITFRNITVSGFMVEVNSTNNTMTELITRIPNAIIPDRNDITIKQAVTKIADDAFKGQIAVGGKNRIKLIQFEPNGKLKKIGNNVFETDAGGDIALPNSLETIGSNAFINCNFDSIIFGNQLKEIGASSFKANTFYGASLKAIRIPGTVTEIGDNAFYNLSALDSLTFGGDVPGGGTSRQLNLANKAFGRTPISVIYGSEWQEWARTLPGGIFK